MKVSALAPIDAMSGAYDAAYVTYRMRLTNQNRQMLRQYVIPNNPDTEMQALIRAYTTAISNAWLLVTEEERTDWEFFGSEVTLTDALGREYHLAPNAAYMRVNLYRLLNGQTITDVAPTHVAVPAPTSVSALMGDPSITISGELIAPNGTLVLVRASPQPLPGLTRRARRNEMRILTTDTDDAFGIVAGNNFTAEFTPARASWPAAPFAIGIQVLAMSATYVPGGTLFAPRVTVESP